MLLQKQHCRGPIAAVREGDTITFDIPNRKLTVEISDEEIANRLKSWQAPQARFKRGVFAKYAIPWLPHPRELHHLVPPPWLKES